MVRIKWRAAQLSTYSREIPTSWLENQFAQVKHCSWNTSSILDQCSRIGRKSLWLYDVGSGWRFVFQSALTVLYWTLGHLYFLWVAFCGVSGVYKSPPLPSFRLCHVDWNWPKLVKLEVKYLRVFPLAIVSVLRASMATLWLFLPSSCLWGTMASSMADSKPNTGLANSLSNVFKLVSCKCEWRSKLISIAGRNTQS